MYIVILLIIIGLCLFYKTGARETQYGGVDAGKDNEPSIELSSIEVSEKSALLAECMNPDNSDFVMQTAIDFGIPQGTRVETCQRLVDQFIKRGMGK